MRIKGKYVAEITITFDAKVDYDDGVDFETMKKTFCEETTPELKEMLCEEFFGLPPKMGNVEVRQVSAELHEVDE